MFDFIYYLRDQGRELRTGLGRLIGRTARRIGPYLLSSIYNLRPKGALRLGLAIHWRRRSGIAAPWGESFARGFGGAFALPTAYFAGGYEGREDVGAPGGLRACAWAVQWLRRSDIAAPWGGSFAHGLGDASAGRAGAQRSRGGLWGLLRVELRRPGLGLGRAF